MKKRILRGVSGLAVPAAGLAAAACLALAACGSGPSSSGPSPSAGGADAALERRVEHVEGLLARRPQAARILDALVSALPDRVWLTEAVFDSGKVRIKGNARSNEFLADYIERLGESQALENLTLGASVLRTVKGRERVEFSLAAAAREEPPGAPAPSGASPASRLEELEKDLQASQDSSALLREIQRLALDSGLRMTKFAPGAAVPGEFTTALPVGIEVSGGFGELGRFLRGLAALPGLWVVERFSARSVSPDDPRSSVRASVSARAFARN
ncbi:MAG TPA: type 4a pilus biogenesis protein PilO [Candidatus Aminicenantes bacterium]|nr:type 4a pilus biogenesis protein PilO [Candidatus Aminicenantes bacterium]HRY66123.1 type 4a pilus biogenesis protein PilO [Candidatus Aminicenantes bacterium]HRZ73037.1 type 4a pilus biogenesis protein PilO [Candidatus Aminicenantes bacterium]